MGTAHACVYTWIQLQKMPKLIKQAFFPCNPHTDVRTAMHYAAAATTGAARSALGASGTHLHRSNDLPPTSGFARKRPPPAQCSKGTGLSVCSFQPWIPSKVPKAAQRCQAVRRPGFSRARDGQGAGLLLAHGGWLDGEGSAACISLAEEHPSAGDSRWLCWPGSPRGTAQRQGLAVLRVR